MGHRKGGLGSASKSRRRKMIKRGRKDGADTYYSHAAEAGAPASERPETVVRRDGSVQAVRRHHLSADDLQRRTAEMTKAGRWIGPFNRWKTYWAIVEALYQLGPNERHLFGAVFVKVEELMSDEASANAAGQTAWYRFVEKDNRNETSGKDALGRMWDSIRVLQRLGGANPYGLKLAQLGACINVYGSREEPYIELRIGIPAGHDVAPINETRSRDYPRSVTAVPSGYQAEGGLNVIDLAAVGDPHASSCSAQPMTVAQGVEALTEVERSSG